MNSNSKSAAEYSTFFNYRNLQNVQRMIKISIIIPKTLTRQLRQPPPRKHPIGGGGICLLFLEPIGPLKLSIRIPSFCISCFALLY